MSAAIAKTTLGPAPWPAKPRRVPKVYETIKLESLSLTDDKMTAKRAKAGSKYDALFRAALDTGKAIKTPGGAAASAGNIARTWLAHQGITGYVPRSGPVPWTRAQIAQHARQQLAQLPEAPL